MIEFSFANYFREESWLNSFHDTIRNSTLVSSTKTDQNKTFISKHRVNVSMQFTLKHT